MRGYALTFGALIGLSAALLAAGEGYDTYTVLGAGLLSGTGGSSLGFVAWLLTGIAREPRR